VKQIIFESEAQTAGKFDLGLFYATDGEGGKPTSLLVSRTRSTPTSSPPRSTAPRPWCHRRHQRERHLHARQAQQPIWQAAGLTTDPGGYFDIVASGHHHRRSPPAPASSASQAKERRP
jgi:hypothetical protein